MTLLRPKSIVLVAALAASLALAASELLGSGRKELGIALGAASLVILAFATEHWSMIDVRRWFLSGFINGLAAFQLAVMLFVTLGWFLVWLEISDIPGASVYVQTEGFRQLGIIVLAGVPVLAALVVLVRGLGWLYRDRHAA